MEEWQPYLRGYVVTFCLVSTLALTLALALALTLTLALTLAGHDGAHHDLGLPRLRPRRALLQDVVRLWQVHPAPEDSLSPPHRAALLAACLYESRITSLPPLGIRYEDKIYLPVFPPQT